MKPATALLIITCAMALTAPWATADLQNVEIIHDPLIGSGFDEWQTEDSEQPNRGWLNVGDATQSEDDPRLLTSTSGTGILVNGKSGGVQDLVSKKTYGDFQLHVEFMVPKGSNSGVYLQGRYEIQVFDSWGREDPGSDDCGGIYQRRIYGSPTSDEARARIADWEKERGRKLTEADGDAWRGFEGHPPSTNASKPPGEWQTFDITFLAPRFDKDGVKTKNARFVKVVHNGVTIHENVELTGPTTSATFQDEKPKGPLMLQGDHGPVAYRNIIKTQIPDVSAGSISKSLD